MKEGTFTINFQTGKGKDKVDVTREVEMKNLENQGDLEDYLLGMGELMIKQIVTMIDNVTPEKIVKPGPAVTVTAK